MTKITQKTDLYRKQQAPPIQLTMPTEKKRYSGSSLEPAASIGPAASTLPLRRVPPKPQPEVAAVEAPAAVAPAPIYKEHDDLHDVHDDDDSDGGWNDSPDVERKNVSVWTPDSASTIQQNHYSQTPRR